MQLSAAARAAVPGVPAMALHSLCAQSGRRKSSWKSPLPSIQSIVSAQLASILAGSSEDLESSLLRGGDEPCAADDMVVT